MYRQPNYVTKEAFSRKILRRTIKVFYIYISSQCYFLKLPPTLMFSLFKRDFVWQYWLGAYYCRPTLMQQFIKTKSTTLLNFEVLKSQKDNFLDKYPYTYMYIHTLIIIINNYFSGLHNNYSFQINHGWGTDSWSWRRPVYMVAPLLANTHTCLYGSQISNYFGLNPPPPPQFRDIPTVGWRLLTCRWFRELIPRWYGMATFSNINLQTGSYRIGRNCS